MDSDCEVQVHAPIPLPAPVIKAFVGFFYLCFLVIPAMYLVMFFSGKANIEILKIGAKKRREKMCFGVICVSANVST